MKNPLEYIMSDDGIRIELTAQDSGAIAMLEQMEAHLQQVQTQFEAATSKAGAMSGAVGKSAAESVAGMEALQRAGAGVGTTMELLGVQSAGAAQHVRLMGTAIQEL